MLQNSEFLHPCLRTGVSSYLPLPQEYPSVFASIAAMTCGSRYEMNFVSTSGGLGLASTLAGIITAGCVMHLSSSWVDKDFTILCERFIRGLLSRSLEQYYRPCLLYMLYGQTSVARERHWLPGVVMLFQIWGNGEEGRRVGGKR